MSPIQKTGFIAAAVVLSASGLVFLMVGVWQDNTVLLTMGAFWLPAGLIQLAIALYFIYHKKK